jgi:hypothetical protein
VGLGKLDVVDIICNRCLTRVHVIASWLCWLEYCFNCLLVSEMEVFSISLPSQQMARAALIVLDFKVSLVPANLTLAIVLETDSVSQQLRSSLCRLRSV